MLVQHEDLTVSFFFQLILFRGGHQIHKRAKSNLITNAI